MARGVRLKASGSAFAWVGLATLWGVAALLAFRVSSDAIDWQPELAFSEPWRAFSAIAVHYSGLHLAANLAGAVLVGALGAAGPVPMRSVVALLLAWPLTQFGLLAQPGLLHYGGLSGVLHAGVAVVAVHLLLADVGPRRRLGAVIFAVLVAKLLSETPWTGALRHPSGWDIAVAPGAHVSGVVCGTLLSALAEALHGWHARRRQARPGGRAVGPASYRPLPSRAMTERHSHLDGIAVISLIACCFLWGLNPVAAKMALTEVSPLQQAAIRSVGAALLVWGWAAWRGVPLFRRDGTLPGGVLAGLLFAAEFVCIFFGLQFTSASRMAVFIYLSPFVVALGMPFISRAERLSPWQSAGLVLAFAGVAWAFAEGFSGGAIGPRQWLGDALGVLAAVFWAATTLVIRGSRLASAAPEKTLFYQLTVSGAALVLGMLVHGDQLPKRLSTPVIGSLLFQTIVVVFASYLLWFWLVRHYQATRLSAFSMLTPVFGLLLGALLLGEAVTTRLVIALLAVAAGIVLVNRRRAP